MCGATHSDIALVWDVMEKANYNVKNEACGMSTNSKRYVNTETKDSSSLHGNQGQLAT